MCVEKLGTDSRTIHSELLVDWSKIARNDKGVATLTLRDDLKKSLACGFSLIVADSDSLLVLWVVELLCYLLSGAHLLEVIKVSLLLRCATIYKRA